MLRFLLVLFLAVSVTEGVKYQKSNFKRESNQSFMAKRQARTCGEDQFKCTSGECILAEWVCDTQADCADGSDEKECHANACRPWQVQCQNSAVCIESTWLCDGDDVVTGGTRATARRADRTTSPAPMGVASRPLAVRRLAGLCDATLHPSVCNDRLTIRGCALMNDASFPICLDDGFGFKYCRNFCDLCLPGD